MTKNFFIFFLSFFFFYSCQNQDQTGSEEPCETIPPVEQQGDETTQMVKELKALAQNGNPLNYYHWNSKRAQHYKTLFTSNKQQFDWNSWTMYCTEILNSGQSKMCINEIEKTINATTIEGYSQLINEKNTVVFELLALAYLRLGEQENCQNAHTPFSCILPLKTPAVHQLRQGSEKAIELYELLYAKFPNERYKWLLNLAYMTLGEYPQKVPKQYLISFPNWKTEQKDFPRFEEIATNLGVAVNGLSGGTCVDDFNNDGLIDIFATSYGMQDQVKLFFNDGKGGFKDATALAGLKGIVSGLNCIHADYNNDGYKDILMLRGAWLEKGGNHPNSLLKNNGDGTFSDVTRSAELLSYHPTQTASWGDFNNDGHLDLFIGNESSNTHSHPCELYQNNGDGTFTEVAKQLGLNINAFVKGATWGDINNDGWQDLFISVLGGKNFLFKNINGKFEEISKKAGVQEPFFSFPCWFWDVNNDGWQDLFVSGYDLTNLDGVAEDYAKELQNLTVTTAKPRLYINNGNETFTDKTKAYKIDKSMYAMGANYGDIDNDGYLDFYVGTGAPNFNSVVPNRMFRNVKGEKFEEVTSAGGFGHIQKGHGIAFADIDRDGDQDIYAVMGGAYEGDLFTNVLFENPLKANNWICIELIGNESNKNAIGTHIELLLDNGKKVYRTVSTGGSFGASSLQQEIGVGSASNIKELTIYWTNNQKQSFSNIKVNKKIIIEEGQNKHQEVNYVPIPFRKENNEHHH